MTQYSGDAKIYLRVLYDFKYSDHEGTPVEIANGDECLLLKKTTKEWWYVLKQGDKKPIYVPSNYVEEIHKTVINLESGGEAAKNSASNDASQKKPATKKGPAPAVAPKNKKKIPPKAPPKPSKLIRKPSVEEEVLKELDSILENAFDGEPIIEEEEPVEETSQNDSKRNSNSSTHEKRSSNISIDESRISNTPSESGSVNRKSNVSSVADENSSDNTKSNDDSKDSDTNRNSVFASVPDEPEPDYGNDSGDQLSPTSDKSASLASPTSMGNETKDAGDSGISEGSTEHLDKKGKTDSLEKKKEQSNSLETDIPVGENLGNDDNELPDYQNFNYVRDTVLRNSKQEESDLPDYANLSEIQAKIFNEPPPVEPPPGKEPVRRIDEWEEHKDHVTGRSYYFNTVARDSTWQPPSCFNVKKGSAPEEPRPVSPVVVVPSGWAEERDDAGVKHYINQHTNQKWRSSVSPSGKTYFYNEKSGESLWELPEVQKAALDSLNHHQRPLSMAVGNMSTSLQSDITSGSEGRFSKKRLHGHIFKNTPPARMSWAPGDKQLRAWGENLPMTSPLSAAEEQEGRDSVADLHTDLDPASLQRKKKAARELRGSLKRCKVLEHGKKANKSWSEVYAVLKAGKLSFYKNQKAAFPKSGPAKTESEIELSGCIVEIPSGTLEKKEKRKYVLTLTTDRESQFYLQLDSEASRNEWHQALQSTIHNTQEELIMINPEVRRSQESISSNSSSLDRKKKINPLDAVFGNHLHRVCDRDRLNVPHFVTKVIASIEKKGLKTDGIYRVSGNMAEIQKLRFLVDSGAHYTLDGPNWEVHVLTGALKLFFRELKEPLIPFYYYSKFLEANQLDMTSRQKVFRDLIKMMPPSNRETLEVLMVHLDKVVQNSSHNRMQVQNLAIVFGPTLMWPEDDTGNVAVTMVQSGQIVEYLLQEQSKLFL